MTRTEHVAQLKNILLCDMHELGASQDYCLTHSGIGWDDVPKQLVSALLKSLKDDGLVFFMNGLWTEDGEMAGAGHGLTLAGEKMARRLIGDVS